MHDEIRTNYHFSVKNVHFFKNALSLLNVDDSKSNSTLKRNGSNSTTAERENCILFNLYSNGLMLRSLSRCKQIYCFLYIDANCFASYNMLKGVETYDEIGVNSKNAPDAYKEGQELKYRQNLKGRYEETGSINSDNLFTSHIIDNGNKDVVKLKAVSPLKNVRCTEEDENEYSIRKKIYEEIDEKKNCFEFLVSLYELLTALEFLNPVILNMKFDYLNKKLILQLTDEDGDTSETSICIIVDCFYQIYRLEKYSFLTNNYTYFSLQSAIFSFYLEYIIRNGDQCITFHLLAYTDEATPILKMETKNKNCQRSVQMTPKENFDEFKICKNQIFNYRVKDFSKIPQALKISSHLRMDFQENGLLRFQFTLREYNMNGTHLCYFVQPVPDINDGSYF
ncbi:conserved Plasmodium protein, unknown function [Plasmodium ovale]|uniref:Uncharacterized protein n=1 Tax=Plasmodium ovale TaxID=36330 RepID=A0A1D3TL48_PLAOA|nr:conserved Plasmodium protein, unknown function [Plasmodium ovale]